ncbi:MAG: hypothetical protein ACTTKN_03685 [Phocaeicola sp.]|uniref:hypothetical protein n=1 Tax=Phocaeicola TaxID=909656 RepID=UPI00234EBA0A|nr:hypothetical protein [Phocaeicola oris]MCE2615740.1 hypothetical protein [Phocaeicola oris]
MNTKDFLHLIILFIALTFACAGKVACLDIPRLTGEWKTAEAVQHTKQEKQTNDYAFDSFSHNKNGVANIQDVQNIYRICNSRPQRVLPSFRTNKPMGKMPLFYKYTKYIKSNAAGKFKLETAPYQTEAVCDYYVIALRHILC